jgi:hypothetical protein
MTLTTLRTASQAAERLQITRRGVLGAVERDRLKPAGKLPGRTGAYLFTDDELDRYAADRRQAGGEAAA